MESLAVYIHWPFCVSKCPYCDFNSHVRDHIDVNAWTAAYQKNIQYFFHRLGASPPMPITSIFFGGGTPSLMPPFLVAEILEMLRHYGHFDPRIEITLEANPGSVDLKNIEILRSHGINRLSLGVQSLQGETLKKLGRQHDVKQAKEAIACAQTHFDTYSLDFIYTHPWHTLSQWQEEMTEILAFNAPHLSLYQLTIEPQTPFYLQHQKGILSLPENDVAALFYETTTQRLEAYGLTAYEISNYAQPGQQCRHNRTYWTYGDYIGIGPGAHGRITENGQKILLRQHRSPELWLQSVQEQGHGLTHNTPLRREEILQEKVLMGLRLKEGLELSGLNNIVPQPFWDYVGQEKRALLESHRYVYPNEALLQLTPQGRLRLDGILRYLFEDRIDRRNVRANAR